MLPASLCPEWWLDPLVPEIQAAGLCAHASVMLIVTLCPLGEICDPLPSEDTLSISGPCAGQLPASRATPPHLPSWGLLEPRPEGRALGSVPTSDRCFSGLGLRPLCGYPGALVPGPSTQLVLSPTQRRNGCHRPTRGPHPGCPPHAGWLPGFGLLALASPSDDLGSEAATPPVLCSQPVSWLPRFSGGFECSVVSRDPS